MTATVTTPTNGLSRPRRGDRLPAVVARRVAWGVVTVWGALTLVFVFGRLTGDPAKLMAPPGAGAASVQHTRVLLGLDRPILSQYETFLSGALHGSFGQSYYFRTSAVGLVMAHLTATLELAGGAAVLAIFTGLGLGMVAAFRRKTLMDGALGTVAALAQAIPDFWLGPVLILVFGVTVHAFPVAGRSGFRSYVLPILTLGLLQAAILFRVTRAAAIESLGQDYVRMARSKGAGSARVALSHVLPATALPVLTVGGLIVGNLIGGSVIVETVFSWPGIGQLMIQSVQNRDFPVIESVALVFSIGFVLVNTVVDVLYGVLDPRAREISRW